jgi:hypothetical protein
MNGKVLSSFRDPSGFLFHRDGSLYRQVNQTYKDNYDHFISSGLYKSLVDAKLLIPHEETEIEGLVEGIAYKVLKPESISFVSYPYEWSFSQLKDAALTTLEIQKTAIKFGMSLKDASAYNIQFRKGSPIFIDTLSFEMYHEGKPWVAYKQFCQHFLAPLAISSHVDMRLSQLLRIYMDGVPLDLASSLLPLRTYLSIPLLVHIHLHAKGQKHFESKKEQVDHKKIGKSSVLGLILNLESAIKGLSSKTNDPDILHRQTDVAAEVVNQEKTIVSSLLDEVRANEVWDLDSKKMDFSLIANSKGITTVSFDMDPHIVEKNYIYCKKNSEINILPLLLDLTNPSPAIGWANQERMSLSERGPVDTVLALGLLHYLAFYNNLPLDRIARFLRDITHRFLIIEFVPKTDPDANKFLANRIDIFQDYTQQNFEESFKTYFNIERVANLTGCDRVIYLMKNRKENEYR